MDTATIQRARAFAIAYKLEGRYRLTRFSDGELAKMIGGKCGPGTKWGDWLVPETMWGVWVGPACLIHDFDYSLGKTLLDKEDADKRFHRNIKSIIRQESGWLNPFRYLRLMRARTYYEFVKRFGYDSFG